MPRARVSYWPVLVLSTTLWLPCGGAQHGPTVFAFRGRAESSGDANGNGLDDAWEARHGVGELPPGALAGDLDGDGLDLWQEARLGTDPWGVDTDGDGVADGLDACPCAATDQDADGLPDDWECANTGGVQGDPADDPDADGVSVGQAHGEGCHARTANRVDADNRGRLLVYAPAPAGPR